MTMNKDYMKYIGALLLYGSNGIVASAINLPSYEIVLLRALLGGGLLAMLFAISGKRSTLRGRPRVLVPVIVSGIATGICWMLIYAAYQEVGVGLTSLLYTLGPVIVLAASPFLFGERIGGMSIAGFGIVLIGAFLINGTAIGDGASLLGIVLGLAAAFAYAALIVFTKKAGKVDGLECSMVQLASAFVTIAVVIVVGQAPCVIPAASDVAPLLVLALVNTGIGCFLYCSSITRISAQSVAVLNYIEPIAAVLLSALVLQEAMVPVQYAGIALVIAGAVFCEAMRRREVGIRMQRSGVMSAVR